MRYPRRQYRFYARDIVVREWEKALDVTMAMHLLDVRG